PMTVVRSLARPMIGQIFVSGGVDVLLHPGPRADVAGPLLDRLREIAPFLPEDRVTLVRGNAAAQVVAGALLATGRVPRLAALVLAGSLVPTTIGGHPFWRFAGAQRSQQRTQVQKNLAILGGLLLAGVDTEGRPSLLWRARHAAAAARRAGRPPTVPAGAGRTRTRAGARRTLGTRER
ncbi:MAG TPA: DoxX family protein, partial [Mycobacteriales bacterium]|nr:DoxX family protein [Mycobacteriales bacterium]